MLRPSEMALDPGPSGPISIDTRRAVGAVEADGRAFAAADLGRAKMGEAAGNLGGHMEKLALAQMDAINVTKRAEAQNLMTAAEGEMAARVAAEPDETKWGALAAEHMAKTRASIGKLALSPVAKAAVESDFSRWEAHRISGVKVDSARQSIAKARSAINDKLDLYEQKQSSAEFESNLQGAVAGGYLTPEGAEMRRLRYKDVGKQQAREAEVQKYDTGQNAAVAAVDAGGQDTALKQLDAGAFGQYSPTQKERLRNVIQSVARDRRMEDAAKLTDYIATGGITIPEEIDAWSSVHLGTEDRAALKGDLLKREDAKERARLNDPDVQFSIYGRLLARGQAWNRDAPDAEAEYFAIHRESLQLPEGLRGEVTGPIERKRARAAPEPDDALKDYAKDRLTRLYTRGAMGQWKIPGDGKSVPDSENPAVRDEADRVLAKTTRGINRWLKANPNASEEQVDAAMQQMMAGHVDRKMAAQLLDEMDGEEPPNLGAPAGAPAAAVPSAGKGTKFGWAGDPNSDTLSVKGIGAFSGTEGEAAGKAGRPHELRLKRGDLAVSPDVEADLRRAGINPRDTLKVTFKDGSTRTTRWMDRTADSLRGRWDFFTPDGQDPTDGQSVVSFTPVKAPK